MTRRDFLSSGVCLAASAALGNPIRSSIGGRGQPKWGDDVPYDAPIEYLESTGGQWINTGYVPNLFSQFDLKFSPNNVDFVAHAIHGNANSTTTKYSQSVQSPLTLWTGNGYNNRFFYSPISLSGYSVGGIYTIQQSINGIVRNGLHIGTYKLSEMRSIVNEPMWLFHFMNGANPAYGLLKMYYWRVSENGILMMDLMPVRFTNELGIREGAMYDRVSGELFRNRGTGSFLIGPDL